MFEVTSESRARDGAELDQGADAPTLRGCKIVFKFLGFKSSLIAYKQAAPNNIAKQDARTLLELAGAKSVQASGRQI